MHGDRDIEDLRYGIDDLRRDVVNNWNGILVGAGRLRGCARSGATPAAPAGTRGSRRGNLFGLRAYSDIEVVHHWGHHRR